MLLPTEKPCRNTHVSLAGHMPTCKGHSRLVIAFVEKVNFQKMLLFWQFLKIEFVEIELSFEVICKYMSYAFTEMHSFDALH